MSVTHAALLCHINLCLLSAVLHTDNVLSISLLLYKHVLALSHMHREYEYTTIGHQFLTYLELTSIVYKYTCTHRKTLDFSVITSRRYQGSVRTINQTGVTRKTHVALQTLASSN